MCPNHDTAQPLAPATLAVHAGPGPDPQTGAMLAPLVQSTTYAQPAIGVDRGYTYSRCDNPTVAALEAGLGQLEDAPPAVAFSTGMAAISALVLATVKTGDRVICSDVVYGGTVRLLEEVLGPLGVRADFVDTSDPATLERALAEPAALLLIESPANPTLKLTDLAAAAALGRAHGVPVAVDNTFLTAVLQRPLDLGADVAVYSTTKFIEGHNATVGGALLTREGALVERLRRLRKTLGSIQAPFDAWLTLRGLATLPLRLERHGANALAVARFLETAPAVRRVHFPGLETFPQRDLAQRQQTGPGGVLAFELEGGEAAARRFAESLRLCTLAENLGAAHTLVTHPATMTHADVAPAERERLGIGAGLVRVSVGLEEPADLIADLGRALERACEPVGASA